MSEAHRELTLPIFDRDQTRAAAQVAFVGKVARRNSLAHELFTMAREPLMVLDRGLRLVAASRTFYQMFQVEPAAMLGHPFHESGFGPSDIPSLEQLLQDVVAGGVAVEAYEVELDVPGIGRRPMLLNVRQVWDEHNADAALLVGLEDLTARREAESLRDAFSRQEDALLFERMLLGEVQHRAGNSLQIIASILLLKARAVQSEETRFHLSNMRERVILIATAQRQLYTAAGAVEDVECGPYLSLLCEALGKSMIADDQAIEIRVSSTPCRVKSSDALCLGLILTELVMNALKHGFPDRRAGHIAVDFVGVGSEWRLSVSDNGVGRQSDPAKPDQAGLGTSIIEALARQLKAKVEIYACKPGTATSITHTPQAGAAAHRG